MTTQLRVPAGRNAEIAPANAAESSVLASFVHEINNPLEALLNLLHLLESEGILTDTGREHLALAREEVRRISQFAHAALNNERDKPLPQETDVSLLFRSVLQFYQEQLTSRGIHVLAQYGRNGNLKVYAGPLRQMFSNLLLNAADAMRGGGTMYVRCAAGHEWNGQKRRGMRLTVADNGCGIAAKNLSRITEPFFSTKGSDGNGMGLLLVADVVRKHRGVLRVRSSTKAGHSGSVFSIFLPAA
jgi:two-component system CheB/CheR fusion protein